MQRLIRVQPAAPIQRDDEEGGAESTLLVQPSGLSVSLSGITVTVPAGSRYRAGTKAPQAIRIVLLGLLGNQYTDGMETSVISAYQSEGGSLEAWTQEQATAGEAMPGGFVIQSMQAPLLFQVIEARGLRLTLSAQQRQLLEKGRSVARAWRDLQGAQQRGLVEPVLPDWYSENLFTRRLAQHAALITQYENATTQATEGTAGDAGDPVLAALQAIVHGLRPEAMLWEAYLADEAMMSGELGERLQEMNRNHHLLAGFLAYTATQPVYSERALTEHDARIELLRRYTGAMARMMGFGDEQLSNAPGRANADALPAQMSSAPALSPPLFDAALGTDHTFIMRVQFPDVFEAFATWYYRWDVVRVPPQEEGEEVTNVEDLPEGDRPGWSEVYATRLGRATDYAEADIRRVVGELGPQGISPVSLVAANSILRYAGTIVSTFFEQVFTPRYEQKVVLPEEGLYMVRCRAGQVLEGDEAMVRVPSVTYQLVYARNPNRMAQMRVRLALREEQQLRTRLAEIEQSLQDNPDQPELVQLRTDIQRALGPIGPLLTHQKEELTRSINRLREQINATTGYSERRTLEAQLAQQERALDQLNEILETRQARAELHGPGAAPERLTATFVSDLGQTLGLSLEAVDRGVVGDRHTYYVADSTTPNSQEAERSGATRAEAILAAIVAILESGGGYGRGRISVHLDGNVHTRRIEADTGQLLNEAVENITTLVSIAAVAAAPLTGGVSLAILLPVGVVGALPSAYRLIDRAQTHTLHWGLQDWMDVANIAGGLAGAGQTLRLVRLGNNTLMVFGLGADVAGVVLLGASIVEQLDALRGLPEGERAARTLQIMGQAMVSVGITAGTALMRRAVTMRPELAQPTPRPGVGEPPTAPGRTHPPAAEPGRSPAAEPQTPRTPAQPTPGRGADAPPAPTPQTTHPADAARAAIETAMPEATVMMPADRANASPQEQLRYVRDAQTIYENTWRGMTIEGSAEVRSARSREAALYRNSQSGDFIVIQGGEGSVHVGRGASGDVEAPGPGGYAQRWKEILNGRDVGRWELVAHSHPIDPATGFVSNANRLPSGATGDIGVLVDQSNAAGGTPQRSRIHFETPQGPNHTDFGYDPTAANKVWIEYPEPSTGQRQRLEFPDLQSYHQWMRRTHGVEMGAVPAGLAAPAQGRATPAGETTPTVTPATGGTPRAASRRYRALGEAEQQAVNREVDRRFQQESGVSRRLNPNNPADQPLVRRWLQLRDGVMADYDSGVFRPPTATGDARRTRLTAEDLWRRHGEMEDTLEQVESHPDAERMADVLDEAAAALRRGQIQEADALLEGLAGRLRTAQHMAAEGAFRSRYGGADEGRMTEFSPTAPSGAGRPVLLDATAPLAGDPTGQRLIAHVQDALVAFETEGFTPRQQEALRYHPEFEAAYRGSRIDEFAKARILRDPDLQHVLVTVNYERGADFYDSRTGQWYDITTTGAWKAHVRIYGPLGFRLPTEPAP